MMVAGPAGSREVLFEFVIIGAYAKVSAVDSLTGTEVSVTGPAGADRTPLRVAALEKLEFVLAKEGAGRR